MTDQGYSVAVVPFAPPARDANRALWQVLSTEYTARGLQGAVLVGKLPFSRTLFYSYKTDHAFMNMTAFQDISRRDIWVSRFYALSGTGTQLFAGSEVELLRRALRTNHAYRIGASRLPDTTV
jgi:hypothetical protein